jgi:hypothetical protein
MRHILLAGAGVLAALAAPVALNAQTAASTVTTADGRTYTLTAEQQATFNGWTAEQRAAYSGWPYDNQVYYWSLTPDEAAYYWTLAADQQKGYWALTADQRGMIYKMTPEQRAAAWSSVQAQLAGQTPPTPANQANPPGTGTPTDGVPNPQAAAQAVPPAMPADPSYQGGPYKGAMTPPPADAMAKTYPVCTSKVQDSCQNRGEGGAPGRSRATNTYKPK